MWACQVSILHDCRHPAVVLMLGAWLGEEQLYMIVELMHTDLWHALDSIEQQPNLRWDNRHASLLDCCKMACLHVTARHLLIAASVFMPWLPGGQGTHLEAAWTES